MALITVIEGLPFVAVTLRANDQEIMLNRVLLDTGSAASVFETDRLQEIGVRVDADDLVQFMRGIGGQEPIVEKQVESVQIENLIVSPMVVQIGGLDYGYEIDGILGADFLLQTGAVIDFTTMEIRKDK